MFESVVRQRRNDRTTYPAKLIPLLATEPPERGDDRVVASASQPVRKSSSFGCQR
ncbi:MULTISPECIES: hypothetical protein [unclassified Mycobacterium]|uniref:hypothetical protein n=1 Tax=unclassified Mycobacterium TaxID=2642494 RepID=UPI00147CF458|nr:MULTISPECIES: hypothetical protein [unclassified Mycobacterium]